jgi:nitroreductase
MEKLAKAEHPISRLLLRRWSPLAFSSREVEPEKLLSLLEAARWAPSSYNGQPWSYMVATRNNPAEYERMLSCLADANRRWAQAAPVLMISTASHNFAHNNRPNRHAAHDLGMATMSMVVQAMEFDLYVHQMGGFSPERARELYELPADVEPFAAIAIGYMGEHESLPEDLRARELAPGTRKPLPEFVFEGRWGRPAPWLSGQS